MSVLVVLESRFVAEVPVELIARVIRDLQSFSVNVAVLDGLFIGNPLDSYQDEAFASVLDCVLHQVVHQNGEQVVVSDQQARYFRFNLVLEL